MSRSILNPLPAGRSVGAYSRARKHRVFIVCPCCGKEIPAGRFLNQHLYTKTCLVKAGLQVEEIPRKECEYCNGTGAKEYLMGPRRCYMCGAVGTVIDVDAARKLLEERAALQGEIDRIDASLVG